MSSHGRAAGQRRALMMTPAARMNAAAGSTVDTSRSIDNGWVMAPTLNMTNATAMTAAATDSQASAGIARADRRHSDSGVLSSFNLVAPSNAHGAPAQW